VGAGPGDPRLLTLGGLDRLKDADVVIYDRLVSRAVLDMIPHGVARVYGGKDPGPGGEKEQRKLNDLMLRKARSGKHVVRLKGGDPFLFSRGGEEAEFLRKNGVEFEVVPGVTSALAVPAYAGIPLTYRGLSSSVTVVTGQEAGSKRTLDWASIARGSDVVVVLMGAAKVKEIATELLRAGKPAKTPVAAITWGTTKKQRTVTTTLGEASKGGTLATKIEAPSVIVVGKVANLARKLGWRRESA